MRCILRRPQIINPDEYKDMTLLNRQARRNIIEDADGDVKMGNAEQEEEVETRPTKSVTSEITVKVRLALPHPSGLQSASHSLQPSLDRIACSGCCSCHPG